MKKKKCIFPSKKFEEIFKNSKQYKKNSKIAGQPRKPPSGSPAALATKAGAHGGAGRTGGARAGGLGLRRIRGQAPGPPQGGGGIDDHPSGEPTQGRAGVCPGFLFVWDAFGVESEANPERSSQSKLWRSAFSNLCTTFRPSKIQKFLLQNCKK